MPPRSSPRKDRRAAFDLLRQCTQRIIAGFDGIEQTVGSFLVAHQQPDATNPFRLSERRRFLVAEMGQQRRAYVAQRIVAAPFEWRDKDEVGCDVQNHFVVEVAFDADALRRAFAEPPAHRFVVQVTGRGYLSRHPAGRGVMKFESCRVVMQMTLRTGTSIGV